MKRNAQYVGQRRRTVRYTAEQWRDVNVRKQAFVDARREAMALKGEIIIKVQQGRRSIKVASVKIFFAVAGNRVGIYRYEYPHRLLDKPTPPNE